jgi:cyclopropane-fatty-acyl-phospholipid synthase
MHLALFGLLFVGFSWIALAVCLFLYAVRVFALTGAYHRYFSHNSFKTEDDSRNSLALALLTFGEGWHNNHHRFPVSTRQGFYWWEIDITYYILKVLSWFGLVWDLRPPSEVVYREAREIGVRIRAVEPSSDGPGMIPVPENPAPVGPTWMQQLCMKGVLRYFSKMEEGAMRMRLPDGSERILGNPDADPEAEAEAEAEMTIQDYRFFTRTALGGDIGFGESFVNGEWTTPDLTGLLVRLTSIESRGPARTFFKLSALSQRFNRWRHGLRPNTLAGSRRNIADHYDLSNDFYRLFLDPTLMYSCAIYMEEDQDLEAAQRNRLRTIIEKSKICQSDQVLEIGSGWGGFAIEAARQTGCRVTSITLSQEQLDLARARAEKVDDRVKFELADYREMEGRFDKIISIEMLEAVGHKYLGAFFAACDRLLKPDGLVFLQVITIPDQRYAAYRKSCDWIQKYIFPGGMLPSLTAISDAMTHPSKLMVEHLENIGVHYATTLAHWRLGFLEKLDEVRGLGFDEGFQRKWLYYLAYCEAGFATRSINDIHLVLTRPRNRLLPGPVGT